MYDIERVRRGETKESKRPKKEEDAIDMRLIKSMSLSALIAQNEEEKK